MAHTACSPRVFGAHHHYGTVVVDVPAESELRVLRFYRFVPLPDWRDLRAPLLRCCHEQGLLGTILLAKEGINGTVTGTARGLQALQCWLRNDRRFIGMPFRDSACETPPFHRMRVKLRREIVTMGLPGLWPGQSAGRRCAATDWPTLLQDPQLVLLDVRNRYEAAIGSFHNAVSLDIQQFRAFPDYVQNNLRPQDHSRIAMFCTGGIRCEKASAFLLEQGFREVWQLDGGILRYLEDTGNRGGWWWGECFVFDSRVALTATLQRGSHTQCFACRHPLSPGHRRSPLYRSGVSCPFCAGRKTPKKQLRCEERHRQMALASKRGCRHIGAMHTARV